MSPLGPASARRAARVAACGLLLLALATGGCRAEEPAAPEPGEEPIVEEVWVANYAGIAGDPAAVEAAVDELGGAIVGEWEGQGGPVALAWFPSRNLDELAGYRSGLANRGFEVSRITRDEVERLRRRLD